jgi:hypothetical protein
VTAHANRALRLSPFDPVAFVAHMALGHVAVYEAHYDEAVSHYAKAVQANPRHSWLYFCHAVALALAGRVEDARLSDVCWNSIRVFAALGSSTTQQSEHSRLGSKKAHAYSTCRNSCSTRTVESRRAACRRRAA